MAVGTPARRVGGAEACGGKEVGGFLAVFLPEPDAKPGAATAPLALATPAAAAAAAAAAALPAPLPTQLEGTPTEQLGRLLVALSGERLKVARERPDLYSSATGKCGIKCYRKTSEGFLYPLTAGIFFAKPCLFVPVHLVGGIYTGRAGQARTFDVTVQLEDGQKPPPAVEGGKAANGKAEEGGELEFTMIEHDELAPLSEYVAQLSRLRDAAEKAAAASGAGGAGAEQGGEDLDSDSSNDSDYGGESSDDDSSEESSSSEDDDMDASDAGPGSEHDEGGDHGEDEDTDSDEAAGSSKGKGKAAAASSSGSGSGAGSSSAAQMDEDK